MEKDDLVNALGQISSRIYTYDSSKGVLLSFGRVVKTHPLVKNGRPQKALLDLIKDLTASDVPISLQSIRGVGGLQLSDHEFVIAGPLSSDKEDKKLLRHKLKSINAVLELYAKLELRRADHNSPIDKENITAYLSKLKSELKLPLPDLGEVVRENESHNTHAYELAHLEGVTRGDPEQAVRALLAPMHGKEGRMGFTALRHHKNSAIINAVLAARAAMRGGLPVEVAYTTADFFILAAEMVKTVEEAKLLRQTITYRFAELVKKHLERGEGQYRAQVRQLIGELNRNIFNEVRREDIVKVINRNVDYAERIFKEDTGLGIMEYLRQLRIHTACDLLLHSQHKIGEIALMLNFSSGSHFARVFKKVTGESPQDYRERLHQD